jgi:hypothetical protein
MFNASPTEDQNFFSRFVSRMWLLPQNSCRAAYKHLLIFPHRNIPRRHLCSCTQGTCSNTNFSRLAESTAERKHGATLHKGSALKPTVCELAMTFEGRCQRRLHVRQRLSIAADRHSREFFFLVRPTFNLPAHIRRRILEALSKLFTK